VGAANFPLTCRSDSKLRAPGFCCKQTDESQELYFGGEMISVVGWDIGAANVKAAWLSSQENRTDRMRVASHPFEIWREKDSLPSIMRQIFASVAEARPRAMAVTMTAELSDIFATKREGVLFILECFRNCFPDLPSYFFSLSGDFVPLGEAQGRPLEFAAANWLASAQWLALQFPDCLLVDVGSTTTDIVPVMNGKVSAGRTDLERLSAGELVYTGALRTNVAAIVHSVPVMGRLCRVASEYFVISGDIHLILGHIQPEDYTCTTPDGQPPTVESARRRLARLVCADTEMLSAAEIDGIARYVHARQLRQIREGLEQVLSRLPDLRSQPVIVFGIGSFLGGEAARSTGLQTRELASDWGRQGSAVAPCLAAAHLLLEKVKAGSC
jgi:probable H4MPT-linked C1 transfer pathway protein